MTSWYEKSGAEGDVVISTRIRIARNLKDYPFVNKLSKDGLSQVSSFISNVIKNCNCDVFKGFKEIDMSKLDQLDSVSLVEKHIISPEFASNRNNRKLLLCNDESISIMINEEDHIRLQVMSEGFDLNKAYEIADKIDTELGKRLNFAFDNELGYLTQCPTNLGTAMRASLLLHLPALQESGAMNRIANNLSKLGLTIRGTYGEGSESKGALYQLSNQVTLGISENTAIENLKNIAMQLVEQERATRHSMIKNIEISDSILRSYGIFLNARMISNDEFMNLISNIRFGISVGLIKNISYEDINKLIVNSQPATLMLKYNKNMTPGERDQKRAELIHEVIKVN